MWQNPNYTHEDLPPVAPVDHGYRIATLPRRHGDEFRVSIAALSTRPSVTLRIWTPDGTGQYWPTRKGVTAKISELDDVIEALRQIRDLVDGRERPGDTEPSPVPGGA